MERIKVDTTILKEKSKVFKTSAGVYAQCGSEILNLVAGLPSYDGQLSGPARLPSQIVGDGNNGAIY
jgi:hypothetical protein